MKLAQHFFTFLLLRLRLYPPSILSVSSFCPSPPPPPTHRVWPLVCLANKMHRSLAPNILRCGSIAGSCSGAKLQQHKTGMEGVVVVQLGSFILPSAVPCYCYFPPLMGRFCFVLKRGTERKIEIISKKHVCTLKTEINYILLEDSLEAFTERIPLHVRPKVLLYHTTKYFWI